VAEGGGGARLGPEATEEGLVVGQRGVEDLSATRRRSFTSSARKTWADAPVPMGAMRR
jgi:hypothetical protein